MTNDDLSLQARALADLVDYQRGSVVSRTLLNKPAGTITVFAFDQDQGLSEHTTPHDAFVLTVEGDLQITLAGNAKRVGRGNILLMPAGMPHAVLAKERSKMLLVMLRK